MRDDASLKESLKRIADSEVCPGQRYRHNETRDIYEVIAVGVNEPDLEPLVHYRLFGNPYATVWTRHLDVFCGQVVRGEVMSPRFTRVEL